jgi:hypothetical protein
MDGWTLSRSTNRMFLMVWLCSAFPLKQSIFSSTRLFQARFSLLQPEALLNSIRIGPECSTSGLSCLLPSHLSGTVPSYPQSKGLYRSSQGHTSLCTEETSLPLWKVSPQSSSKSLFSLFHPISCLRNLLLKGKIWARVPSQQLCRTSSGYSTAKLTLATSNWLFDPWYLYLRRLKALFVLAIANCVEQGSKRMSHQIWA